MGANPQPNYQVNLESPSNRDTRQKQVPS